MTDLTADPHLPPSGPPALGGWIALFTGLDRGGVPSAAHQAAIATEDVRFRDHLNDLRGTGSGVVVVAGGGVRIEVTAGFDGATLRRVLATPAPSDPIHPKHRRWVSLPLYPSY
jgi:hypothetical protein